MRRSDSEAKPKPRFGRKPGARDGRPARAERPKRDGRPQRDGAPSQERAGRPQRAGGRSVRPMRDGRSQWPRPPRREEPGSAVSEPMRIAKAMARAGLCSRRDAERWIAEGRVRVNGAVLTTPAVEVKPRDKILVDGEPLPVPEPARLWRYNKPKGVVTTHSDPEGRPTVFETLPASMPRVISIGRLDFNTEGLILLTNDGELARHLELPATGWLRRYRVRAKGRVTDADLAAIKDGVDIDGVHYGPVDAAIDTMQGANIWLTVGIREGKNREVRKVLSHLGLTVNRLIRVSFGPFQLLDLKPGDAEPVRRRVLADQLGPEIAERFHLLDDREEKPARETPRFQKSRRIKTAGGSGETARPQHGEKPAGKPRPRFTKPRSKSGRRGDG